MPKPKRPTRAELEAENAYLHKKLLEEVERYSNKWNEAFSLERKVLDFERRVFIPEWLCAIGRGLVPFGIALGLIGAIVGAVAGETWLFQHGHYVLGSVLPVGTVLGLAYFIGDAP